MEFTGRWRETVWVRLYSLEDRSVGPHNIAGQIYRKANTNQAYELERHKLRLPSLDVEVGVIPIEERGRIFFRINIKFDPR
jgi:hypothetical protein